MGADTKGATPPALTAAQMARIDPETDDTMGQSIPLTESRLFDLVRYARYWLQDEHVISMGEWTWLTMSATGEGTGSVSRNRLEENDRLRAALTAAQARIEALERERDAASSHNRELLLHLAEAQANLNDIASRLAVEDARTTLQAKTIRGLEAVIREYLDALDVACNHVMRTDDDFASYEPIDARLEAAEEAMKAAITPPPASTGEEPTR